MSRVGLRVVSIQFSTSVQDEDSGCARVDGPGIVSYSNLESGKFVRYVSTYGRASRRNLDKVTLIETYERQLIKKTYGKAST